MMLPKRSCVARVYSLVVAMVLAPMAGAQTPAGGIASQEGPSVDVPLASGIDRSGTDPGVRPQDDFFRHENGGWLQRTPMPPDRSTIGSFDTLNDKTQDQLRGLVEAAANDVTGDARSRQVGDLYASFMDEARLETLGVRPLVGELAAIDAIDQPKQLGALFAHLGNLGVATPIGNGVGQDARQATRYVPQIAQGGLGLPDRDYYLQLDDARFRPIREAYVVYLARLLQLAGEATAPERSTADRTAAGVPTATAVAILALETRLARVHTTRVQDRDPVATYHRVDFADLAKLAPDLDWPGYLAASGFAGRATDVIVRQPSYLQGLDPLLRSVPLATWKAYAKARLLDQYAPYLSRDFVDARFAFAGKVIAGTTENRPRWKRGVQVVQSFLGEALGQLYVARYFPAQSKARMESLVANLLATYRSSIAGLDWMTPATQREAQAKLASFTPKIGYPVRWIDYSSLKIDRTDLVGNVMRAYAFENARDLAKLGGPVDRAEWHMTPQTINAYYNPLLNEIVFPAAVLQPPFFDPAADDAVNYGAIGAVIGHEISHGFDDKGSQYDGTGNLRDWWTAEDRARFKAKTEALVAQYAAFEPVPGYHLNGELTLGENIADNSGLAIAYRAYRLSLHGKKPPVIDGLTGDQRFFMGFAQVWRSKTRDETLLTRLKSDPHSPAEFRVNGTVRNLAPFYSSFDVEPGDRMYLAPKDRVSIW